MTTAKQWTKELIREKLETDIKWLSRGIIAIYEKQTKDEQLSQITNKTNNVGFSSCDAYILSSFAEQLKRGQNLSAKQVEIATKKMKKYSGQLAKIANKEI